MKNETLEGWAIKSEIVRNYTVVVALLVASACLIYAVWPATVEPVSESGGIPVIDFQSFVRNDVSCQDSVAVVAIHSYDSDKPIYFEPITAQAEGSDQSTPISCAQGEYQLNGSKLSVRELGEYALDSVQSKKNQ